MSMDKKTALEVVKKNGLNLKPMGRLQKTKKFKKDKEVVLEAVKQFGYALQHADESLRNDPDILAIVNKKK